MCTSYSLIMQRILIEMLKLVGMDNGWENTAIGFHSSCGNTRNIKTGKSYMMSKDRCMCTSGSLKSYHTFRLDFTGHSGGDTEDND